MRDWYLRPPFFSRSTTVGICWILSCVFVAISPTPQVQGQTIIDWTGGGATAAYGDVQNWTGLNVPDTISETARFNMAGLFKVTLDSGVNTSVSDLLVADGDINLSSDGGALASYTADDDVTVDGGDLTVSEIGGAGDVRLTVGDRLTVNGGSNLLVELGSTLSADGVSIGTDSGGGTATIDGSGTRFTVISGGVGLGRSGGIGTLTFQNRSTGNSISGSIDLVDQSASLGSTGRLNVLSGATLETNDIRLGLSASAAQIQEATLTVDGANSVLTQTGASTLTIGDDVNPLVASRVAVANSGEFNTGAGQTLIRNQGRLDIQATGTFNANGDVVIDNGTIDRASNGIFANGSGINLIAQNGAQLNFNGNQDVDNGATWTLQSGADYNVDSPSDDVDIGDMSDGTLILEDAGTTLTLGSLAFSSIGFRGGTGSVTIRDEAEAAFGDVGVGDSSDANTFGTLNVQNTTQVTTEDLLVARTVNPGAGNGVVNIDSSAGAARLTVNGSSLVIVGAANSNSTGQINIVGSTAEMVGGTGTTEVNASGLIDIDGGTLELNGDLSIDGGEVRRDNGGSLLLAPGSIVTLQNGGALNLNDGFFIAGAGESFTVESGSTFFSAGPASFGSGGENSLIVDGPDSSADIGGFPSWGGQGGNADVVFRNGATGNLQSIAIGGLGDSSASVRVESGASLTIDGALQVNSIGDAQSSAVLTATGPNSTIISASFGTTLIGQTSNGTAALNVLAGGSFIKNDGQVELHPTGTINLDGGTLQLDELSDMGGTLHFVAGSLTLNSDVTIGTGNLFPGSLSLNSDRHLATAGTTSIAPFRTLTLDGGLLQTADLTIDGTLQFNSGTLRITGGNGLTVGGAGPFGSTLSIDAGQTLNVTNTLTVEVDASLELAGGGTVSANAVSSSGQLSGSGTLAGTLTNNVDGEILGLSGEHLVLAGSGNVNDGQMTLSGGQIAFTQDLSNGSTGLVIGNGTLRADGGVMNSGNMAFSATANIIGDVANQVNGTILSSGGTTTFFDDVVNNGDIRTSQNSFSVYFGSYSGNGDSGSGTVIMEGDLKPGSSPGTMAFGGSLSLGVAAELEIEIGGLLGGGQYDQVIVADAASLDGTLSVRLLNEFIPAPADQFQVLTAGLLNGEFVNAAHGQRVDTLGGEGSFLVSYDSPAGTVLLSDFLLAILLGDMDCDGDVDFDDIDDFVLGLSDPAQYANLFGVPATLKGDTDGDGDLDFDDIDDFVGILNNPSALSWHSVPEPAAATLLLLGAAAMASPRRRVRRSRSTTIAS